MNLISIFPLSLWSLFIFLSDVDWDTGVPRRLCDVCSWDQLSLWIPQQSSEAARGANWPADPTTSSVWALPPGRCECVDHWCESTDRSQQRCSLPLCFFYLHELSLFISFSWCPKFRCTLDAFLSNSLTFVLVSIMLKNRVSVLVYFACQRMIKEKTLFVTCFSWLFLFFI